MDHAITVKFPALNVLIPPALKLRGNLQVSRIEVVGGLNGHNHSFDIISSVERGTLPRCAAIRGGMLERPELRAPSKRIDTVFIAEARPRRLAARVRMVIRYDGKRRAPAPHNAPPLNEGQRQAQSRERKERDLVPIACDEEEVSW